MHSIVVERYSSEEAQFCGGKGTLLMHHIVVERYSSEHELYCDREGQVLMTKVRGMETSAQYCGGEDQY